VAQDTGASSGSARVDDVLAGLTLDEKAALTSGVDMWHGATVDRVGLPALKVTDGPVGARGARWVGTTSDCGPCGTALGSTWNPDLVREVGQVLGQEATAKRANVLLAPTVNLHRSPLAGRNFECFSEDPFLTARLAVAFVEGVQSTGAGACIKHLVANDSEFERHTISSQVGERVLRELYLVPFEAAVAEADVASVMAAYNRLNGTYCAEHTWLLRDVLKGEWGFAGPVISDWWGAQSPASVEGGLDLEMPGPAVHMGASVAQRVRDGELDESVLDDQVRRLLVLAERTGVWRNEAGAPESSAERPAHREVLRRAATEGIVLLRNDAVDGTPVLPLDVAGLRRLAVIGPNADATALLGGGSAAVNLHREESVLDGLRAACGDAVEIVHERGVDATRSAHPVPPRQLRPARVADGEHGLTLEYFDNRELAASQVLVERAAGTRLIWLDDDAVPADGFSARLSGTFVAGESGLHTFGLVTGGTGRLLLGGEVVLDNTEDRRPGTAFFGLGSEEIRTRVALEAGEECDFLAEFVSFEGFSAGALQVGYLAPLPDDAFDRAVAAAADADAAVVVIGLNADWETEGEDRADMGLPGGQGELARAVIAANPRTVVLVNAGSPVDLSATVDAPALAQIWYLGQETAGAVADVLTGAVDASGRLPTTLGNRPEDWPSFLNYPGEAGEVLYGEELFMGYRGFDARGTEPAFCFGHGLSTTTFDWGEPQLSASTVDVGDLTEDGPTTGRGVDVTLTVTNTGSRAGVEVVQVYVHDVASALRRPPQELKGFAKVHLAPGASEAVTITLPRRAFAAWDPATAAWTVEPGRFEVRVARSSRDVAATLAVEVTAPPQPPG
jgi:beta-glucosidase